ncbi:MAG: hypothetical protein II956_08025, partial [Bacteroidales bacterium]|nr:hypothetical protein [Bacteroidales bacterium]
ANMDTMEDLAFKEKDSDFVYLSELAEFRAMSIPEQDRYIHQIDQEVVLKNVMDRKYRFGFSEGKEEGREEGRTEGEKIGIEKGEKIGLKKGEKIGIEKGEKQKAFTIARAMKQHGDDIDYIALVTGLTKEEILKL